MDLTSFGKTIRARRISLGMTQKDLGDAIGVTYQYVSELEAGTDKATLRTLIKTASALGGRLRVSLGLGTPDDPLTEEEAQLLRSYRALDDAGRATLDRLAEQWPEMDAGDARTLRGMLDLWKKSTSYAVEYLKRVG